MTNYQKLKQIIQEANPEKFPCICDYCNCVDEAIKASGSCQKKFVKGIIRLADVLLAIGKDRSIYLYVDNLGDITVRTITSPKIKGVGWQEKVARWNLKDNNLDHQSDETKKFLIELLVE